MADNKAIVNPENEAIRLQLLASMLASTNSGQSNKLHRHWPNFWQGLFKKTKAMH